MAKYRIKLSPNMAKQVEGVDKTFDTPEQAYNYGVQKYGSGSYNSKFGWSWESIPQTTPWLKVKHTRVFGGKVYQLFGDPDKKSVVQDAAVDARGRGYYARVVPVSSQDYGGDYTGLYLLYTRRAR